jgi:Zn-dependent protease with chaperone function
MYWKKNKNANAETVLTIIAKIMLWLGIITSIILFIIGIILSIIDEEIGVLLILSSLIVLPTSFLTWAFLKVIVNISNSLKELNQKTKNE